MADRAGGRRPGTGRFYRRGRRRLPLLFHTGTPSAAAVLPEIVEPAAERGMRTIVYSRPGYANSRPQPGRSVADAAADVQAILTHLGVSRFHTFGWSGGGPHALACAALLPQSCAAAATLAGVAPYDAVGLEWLAGMGPENVAEFGAARAGESALTPYLNAEAGNLTSVYNLATSPGGTYDHPHPVYGNGLDV